MNGQSLQFDLLLPQGANSELGRLDPAGSWRVIEDTARLAEELGYRGVWAYDRLDPLPRRGTAPVFDGWTTLAALAKVTDRLRLGLISSAAPLRDVLQLAKHVATLDIVSGGRAALALDTGYRLADASTTDPDVADLGLGAAETAEVLRRLWAGGATSYQGKYVTLDKAFSRPGPLDPTLPLLVLGDAETDPGSVFFDGAIRREEPRTLQENAATGEPAAPMVFLDCRIFEDDLERDRWLSSPHVIIFWSDHPDGYMRRNLVGTATSITQRLQQYVDAGVTDFGLYFRDYPATDTARRFMTEVVPGLTTAN